MNIFEHSCGSSGKSYMHQSRQWDFDMFLSGWFVFDILFYHMGYDIFAGTRIKSQIILFQEVHFSNGVVGIFSRR